MTAAVTPLYAAKVLSAYQNVETPPSGANNFGSMLSDAIGGAIGAGKQAETQALQAIAGGGDLTSVVTAVSRAELALQTTVAIRDRVLQAYQDIIKMPI